MAKPLFYLFNGKVARFGNGLIGTSIVEPPSFEEVTIGDNTWTATDLDVDDGGEGIYHVDGRVFYTWDAAKRVAESIPGWHLATYDEAYSIEGSGTADPLNLSYCGFYNTSTGSMSSTSRPYYWTVTPGSIGVYCITAMNRYCYVAETDGAQGLLIRLVKDS